MEFKERLKEYQDLVNKELDKYVKRYDCPEKIINDSVEYSLMAGGKRLRPILVLDVYKLFKQDYEKAFPFAVALEMVHNFSLIHDDLPEIDNDDFRHGKLTNHKKFNHATALLAGDSLFNEAYIVISSDIQKSIEKGDLKEMQNKGKAFVEFSIAVNRMIAGEYLDTELEGQNIEKELLQYIHENKTGALLKLAVRMGAILAGAEEKDILKLLCSWQGNMPPSSIALLYIPRWILHQIMQFRLDLKRRNFYCGILHPKSKLSPTGECLLSRLRLISWRRL